MKRVTVALGVAVVVVLALAPPILESQSSIGDGSLPAALLQEDEAAVRARAAAALSQIDGTVTLAGLEQPVEVVRDRWGVPHIYARTVHDLFFAQGFVAAQDRLWQLDLWRRMSEGSLAEIVGPSAVNRDTLARLLRYRGDPAAEWAAYRDDAKEIVGAFVAGVNAQVAIANSAPGRLPIEFQLTGSRPGPWTPETVIGRMAGYLMTRNARTEVQRARQLREARSEGAPAVFSLDPPAPVTVPDGLDLADLTEDVLALTTGISETVSFPGFGARAGEPIASPSDFPYDEIGSNDWVVSGGHSATGKPLLANDPHRTLMLPSLRYTVHLNGPGWNVIGAGEPALPGIAAGHNERIAFGFTIVGMDQQDLYVESLDPSDLDRYLYRGASEAMTIERQTIAVRGEAPRRVDLRFTRHGPVLHVDRERRRAYALRWVGAEPGGAGYLKSIALDTARTWSEFKSALTGWKVPSENLVYADVDGNIGWVAAGLAPVRAGWNGLLPVPGHEGKYEWQGFLPLSSLPQAFNPPSGIIATANHNILPAGYPAVLGFEFGAPFRFQRILEVLRAGIDGGRTFTVADFERLQHDERSLVAAAVVAATKEAAKDRREVLTQLPAEDDRVKAMALLTAWDGTLAKGSAAAALYEAWLPKVKAALAAERTRERPAGRAPATLADAALVALLERSGLLGKVSTPDPWVDGTPRCAGCTAPVDSQGRARAAVAAVLTGPSIGEAWRELAGRFGSDASSWAWGRMHEAVIEHPLAGSPALRSVFNLPRVPRGGDSTTPNATGSGARQTAGASFREILDVADWDRSMTINVPGASGQPGSPHYADLLPLWADGRYHPLPFSRKAVDANAAHRLILEPGRASGPR